MIALANILQENTDYFVFLSACIVVLAILDFSLHKFRQRRIPGLFRYLFLAIAIGGYWSVRQAGEEARTSIERVVDSLAPTYAAELERMGHAKLKADTAPDDPLYLSMVDVILKWQRLNSFAHDVYTIRKLPDGRNALIVDPETDYNHDGKFEGEIEQRTPIGTIYEEADAGMDAAFAGRANFNPEIVKDEWGEWVGGWAPIFGPDGKVDAVLGVDFDAKQWTQVTNRARMNALLHLALLLGIVAISGASIAIVKGDVARREQAEKRSRDAEQRMALTLKRMPLGFIEWSTSAKCRMLNPAAERIFGYKAAEVFGKQMFPLIATAKTKEHTDKLWSQLLKQVGGNHSINENVTKDGRVITCEWFNTALTDAYGSVNGAFSIVQDITERVNLEKHVHQAQRLSAVGQLAAGVAHDFNNILTIITGHTGLLLGEENLPMSATADLERIEDAALRASSLTRQLLAFSRLHAMFPRPLHLSAVAQNSAALLGRVLGEGVKFNVEIAEDAPPIEGDPAMLDQVITNLVLNARDAIKPGGSISIHVGRVDVTDTSEMADPDARPGPATCLTVRDTGTGISEEDVDHIFEPFFTTKQPGKGTGLGLSVVHGIVKQHHGWIEVESTVGRGTEFRLFFPPTDKTPNPDDATTPTNPVEPRSGRRKTILLAEDESAVRELARLILERSGYRVIEAADGVEALKLWTQHSDEVDLLLTDMVMPNGVSGRDLSLRILATRPDMPVIYASGYSMELTAPDFHESETQIYLQKPYLTDQLISAVRKCLGELNNPPPATGSFAAAAGI